MCKIVKAVLLTLNFFLATLSKVLVENPSVLMGTKLEDFNFIKSLVTKEQNQREQFPPACVCVLFSSRNAV